MHQLVFLCLHSACVIAEVFSYGGQPEHSYCIICADRFALAQSVSRDYFQCARKPPCCSWQGGTSKDEAKFCSFHHSFVLPVRQRQTRRYVAVFPEANKRFVAVLCRALCARRENRPQLMLCVPRVPGFFKRPATLGTRSINFKESLRVICTLVLFCALCFCSRSFAGL